MSFRLPFLLWVYFFLTCLHYLFPWSYSLNIFYFSAFLHFSFHCFFVSFFISSLSYSCLLSLFPSFILCFYPLSSSFIFALSSFRPFCDIFHFFLSSFCQNLIPCFSFVVFFFLSLAVCVLNFSLLSFLAFVLLFLLSWMWILYHMHVVPVKHIHVIDSNGSITNF